MNSLIDEFEDRISALAREIEVHCRTNNISSKDAKDSVVELLSNEIRACGDLTDDELKD